MAHLAEVSEDLFDRMPSTGPFRVHDVGCKVLRRDVAHGQCRHAFITGAVAGEELVCADGGSTNRLHFHRLASLATWVFVVAFAGGHATLASRMIRDVCKTVDA